MITKKTTFIVSDDDPTASAWEEKLMKEDGWKVRKLSSVTVYEKEEIFKVTYHVERKEE